MDLNIVRERAPYEVVITEIMDLIETGALLPGENLPNEAELAKQLSVAEVDVAKAYQVLEERNIINTRLNSGPFLTLTTRDLMLDRIRVSILKIDNSEIIQLLEIRGSLEKLAIEQAIRHAKKTDLDAIEGKLKALEARIEKHKVATREDLAFHLEIVKATKNRTLIEVMDALFQRFSQSLMITRESIRRLERVDHFIDEHRQIFNAIVERDEVSGSELIGRHILNTIKLYLDEHESSSGNHIYHN